jgi:hypothetical protein
MEQTMSDTDTQIKMPKKIKGEWLYRGLVTALLLMNLWMKTQYVGIERYDADHKEMQAAITRLTETQIEMRSQADVNARFVRQLDDHEDRIRKIERAIK